jgi:hypothetical protein
MFTLEESALLGFMLRISLGLMAAVILIAGCAMGVHWMRAHHDHLPHAHVPATARHV